MSNIVEFPGGQPEMNKEQEAQDLIYDAWESDSPVQRKRLARKAIELDPDCTDAYSILADAHDSFEKKNEYYLKGMGAFKNKYGEEYFTENKGYFWGLFETRPFMRLIAN